MRIALGIAIIVFTCWSVIAVVISHEYGAKKGMWKATKFTVAAFAISFLLTLGFYLTRT